MKTENNGLVPSILHLWSMFPHLSLAPCSAAWAHQACVLVCLFVFIHHCWGRVEGFWSGWGKLYKSRVGGGWRDFSCPGQKESGPGPPPSLTPAPPSLPSLPSSPLWWMMICVTLRLPASTGGQLAACWLAFGWTGGLSWGVICGTWGTLTSPSHTQGWGVTIWSYQAGKGTPPMRVRAACWTRLAHIRLKVV